MQTLEGKAKNSVTRCTKRTLSNDLLRGGNQLLEGDMTFTLNCLDALRTANLSMLNGPFS